MVGARYFDTEAAGHNAWVIKIFYSYKSHGKDRGVCEDEKTKPGS